MANSFVTNLYPKPTDGTTMERLQVTAATSETGNSFQTSYNSITKYIVLDIQDADVRVTYDGVAPTSSVGHILFAGRSYTWAVETARVAKFIRDGGTSAKIHASEFTQ